MLMIVLCVRCSVCRDSSRVFFFKQKTAYEMRISDWSSDVCSSDLMSKSIGNVLLVHDLLKQAPGEAIRLALLSAHYRQPLDWTAAGLREAKAQLDRLYRALDGLKDVTAGSDTVPDGFVAALADDLNQPQALAELHQPEIGRAQD